MIMLVPADWICASIDDCAPVPSATIVITAATPMIMPSMVSAVRILLRLSALNAIAKNHQERHGVLCYLDLGLDRSAASVGELVRAAVAPAASTARSRDHQAVAERHDARAVLGDVRFVRDQHHRDAALAGSGAGRCPSLRCWSCVSRLPVGSSASRIDGLLISARAIATRCCWPPDS